MERAAIAFVMGIVKAMVKNPAKKANLKRVLLKLRDTITAIYEEE
jgi:hypothetical protein